MKSGNVLLIFLVLIFLPGCGGGGSGSSSQDGGATPPSKAANVIPVTVNGALCGSTVFGYPNKPCVSVTVCMPGNTNCQTIDDILLDTGSTGLRIFKQALNISLNQSTIGSGSLAECMHFGDGSSDWGPVQTASVILGGEPAVEVPIQVIDSTFGTLPTVCGNADRSPADAGFNGILGVSFFAQDCGSACVSSARIGMYFSCGGSGCVGTTVPLSSQIQNPVAFLPEDNNGVIVELPGVPAGGATSVDGSLLLGIGTKSNNIPSAVTTYTADRFGNFTTTFNGILYSSFTDTGTNGLFFPSPSESLLPDCAFPNSAWFCPQSTVDLSATITGSAGSPSGAVSFQIGNFVSLAKSSNNVFADVGGQSWVDFEWGLPFFLGRNVYIGLEGKSSSLGSGLYWAY